MRIIILAFLFVGLTIHVQARTYYISATGSDSNSGTLDTTPWQTIAKVNSSFGSLAAGDQILFKRGDTFYGSIVVNKSGTSGNPIVIGAYGTGAEPIFSGFTTVSEWTSYGNGIFYKDITCESVPNMVTLDGVNTPIGRWPNTGWMTIGSHTAGSHTSFTDAALPSSPGLTGADVVVRGSLCLFDRVIISKHSGQTLTFAYVSEEIRNGAGYFIQNHISTLNDLGDWCYTGGRFYMYFGAVDPTTKVVKVSVRDNLISIVSKNYITVENLSLLGANSSGININGSTYTIVKNCNLDFSGNHAIKARNGNNSHTRVESNVINHTNNIAIDISSSSTKTVILSNTVSNTGMIAGMGEMGYPSYTAISCMGNGSLISYNRIINTGYIGITSEGEGWEVSYNYVDYFEIVKDDGGGIYSWKDKSTSGKTISHNIVLHGIGNAPGWVESNPEGTHGIYLDETYGVTISNNTVAHNYAGFGIFLHMSNSDFVGYNTLYDNSTSMRAQSGTGLVRSLNVNNNIFFAKTSAQITFSAVTKFAESDISLFGTIDYNYYARPIDNDNYIDAWYNAWGTSDFKLNLSKWRNAYGYDVNSSISPKTITDVKDLRFEYNATSSPVVITLPYNYMDVTGTTYNGTITLAPYTSAVLIKNGSITNQPPSIQDQGFQLNENSPSDTAVGTVVASDPDAGQTLTYSIVSGNTDGAFAINASTGVLSVANSAAVIADFALVIKVHDNGVGELSSQATIAINIVFTGVELTGNNGTIKVYPNPVSDELIIEIKGNNDILSYNILNSTGQIVFEGNLSEKTVVQTKNFSPGVYIIKIGDVRSFEFKKIVKV